MTCTSVFAEVICLALIVGFTIAQTASPPRWTIVSGSSYCSVSSDGMCITDGSGSYGNDENCTMRAESTMTITSTQFDTEYGYDFIRVLGGGIYSGSTGPMFVQVTAGTLVTWSTDSSSSWRTTIANMLESSEPKAVVRHLLASGAFACQVPCHKICAPSHVAPSTRHPCLGLSGLSPCCVSRSLRRCVLVLMLRVEGLPSPQLV